MKKINFTNDSITIEQFTTVYHKEYGKGSVVTVTFRKDNNLVMCYFPKAKEHDWITEKELRSGMGDVTLTLQETKVQDEKVSDSLQSALENLFAPR